MNEDIYREQGVTLIELVIVIAIIGILASIGIPAYVGQQESAARTEAYSNLQNLRLLEEQYVADNSVYTDNEGACTKDNDNISQIQSELSGFQPGTGLNYSYCIEQNLQLDGTAQTPCFRATAFGNSGTRVDGDIFMIDCNNNKNF